MAENPLCQALIPRDPDEHGLGCCEELDWWEAMDDDLVVCGRPEHPPMSPGWPHEKWTGHPYQPVADRVLRGETARSEVE